MKRDYFFKVSIIITTTIYWLPAMYLILWCCMYISKTHSYKGPLSQFLQVKKWKLRSWAVCLWFTAISSKGRFWTSWVPKPVFLPHFEAEWLVQMSPNYMDEKTAFFTTPYYCWFIMLLILLRWTIYYVTNFLSGGASC